MAESAPVNLETQRAFILHCLEEAGAEGLPKSRLRVSSSASGQLYGAALRSLEEERLIGNLGYAQRSRYVIQHHFNPLERAYGAILSTACANAGRGAIPLYRRETLLEKLPAGAIKRQGEEALRLLLQEGALVMVKTGNAFYYLARALLPELPATLAPEVAPPAPPPPVAEPPAADATWVRVLAAYKKLVHGQGFRDVLIADLHRAMGKEFPLRQLKEVLLQACTQGQAIPSLGDSSMADKKERKAGLEIHGKLHLRIRLEA